uniref:Cytochrome b5 heme-binding domain-containing protein n=1 Tax=Amphora coffeiformis TaxID=265554 RepID=A0A7S3KYT3_9STRA
MKAFTLIFAFASITEARLSHQDTRNTRETWNCPDVSINYPAESCQVDGKTVYRWTLDQVKQHSKQNACLMVIHDTVYEVLGFADIHRGGKPSIIRNCGKDATFGYDSLQCIAGVPDHIPGVLRMLEDNFCSTVAGVIKGSEQDPCEPDYVPVDFPEPDFDSCFVYDVLRCEHLDAMPQNGKWDLAKVQSMDDIECYAILYNYVFAFGLPPQNNPFTPPGSGTLEFTNKHGGGSAAVIENCETDMTAVFESMVNKPRIPDHTPGGLNAILPYLVGVVENSDVDPCKHPPPTACEALDLPYISMVQVRNSNRSRCWVVVMGKVYDLQDFKQHHHGGADEIEENCREDITDDFMENMPPHTLVQLGAIQQFQIGVIEGSMADPCSGSYEPNPDTTAYNTGDGSGDEEEEEDEDEEEDEEREDEPELGAEEETVAFTFKDSKGRERDCGWLGNTKAKIQKKFCNKAAVKVGCNQVCGGPSTSATGTTSATEATSRASVSSFNVFTFTDKNGKVRNCQWLASSKLKLKKKYCSKNSIKNGCKAACDIFA